MSEQETESTHTRGWIAWFAHNPVAANLLMAALLLVGLSTAMTIRTEGFPEVPRGVVLVDVGFNGGTPETVEEGVAIKIEEALNGLEGIHTLTSTVTSDAANISIRANEGYPAETLKDSVKVRIDAITTFPEQVESIVITQEQDERHVLSMEVHGHAEHDVLRTVAKRLRQRLLALSAVNKVTLKGVRTSEINIELREEMLRAYGLTFTDVATAIQSASLNLSAGELKTSSGDIILQSKGQKYHGREFENVVVRNSPDGGIIRVRDVAIVKDAFNEQEILSTFQGEPSINLEVELIGRDSVIQASEQISPLIEKIRAENWIPETIQLTTWADEAELVRDSLGLLSRNALLGMCLVLVLLALFLHPKVAFWVAIGIPVSFAGSFIIMGPQFLDYSINDLTSFAFIIVLGIVVDDAIVIGESIYTFKDREGGGVDTAIRGAMDVATPATFGVLTTVAAFYPLTLISGFLAGPFTMIAVVVIVCLLFSLVESKLILPAHLAHLNTRPETETRNPILLLLNRARSTVDGALQNFIEKRYRPTIERAVAHPYHALGIFISILILAVGLLTSGTVKSVFFGGDEGNLLYATVKMRAGTPVERTHDAAKLIGEKLDDVSSELTQKYALTQNPIRFTSVFANTDRDATVTVEIAPGSERPFYSEEFLNAWQHQVGEITDATELSFYVDFEGSEDLRIEVSSLDHSALEGAVTLLRQKVGGYAGVHDLRTNLDNSVAEIQFQLTPAASSLGLRNRSITEQIRAAVFGAEAQRIQRGDEEVRVKVRYPRGERDNVTDLSHIRLRSDEGVVVPLTSVTNLTEDTVQSEITRINGKRVLTLTAQIDTNITSPTQIINLAESEIFPQVARKFPSVDMQLAGESREEGQTQTQLLYGFILGLMLIYALLAIPLKSYGEPIIIMMAIPFGIVGAIAGHLVIGIPVSLLSFFGILALSGVVVNDSLVYVSRYNQLKQQGASYEEAAVTAGMSRFRAVFLTSITTFVGLVPLLQERSEQAQQLIPMAVSLAFGILFATIITLLIVPVLLGIRIDLLNFLTRARQSVSSNS